MGRFVVISGCSGGGKSTLIDELARRGHAVIAEPGRRIITEERQCAGHALPWIDMAAFARRAVAMAIEDLAAVHDVPGRVFFDRGLVDAASALAQATGQPMGDEVARHRYHPLVFLTPPWPEIHVQDADRPHGLDEAVAEYERLRHAYAALGYAVDIIPRMSVADRADHVLARLDNDRP